MKHEGGSDNVRILPKKWIMDVYSQNLMTLNTFRCSSLHVFTEEDINKRENKCDQYDTLKSRNWFLRLCNKINYEQLEL